MYSFGCCYMSRVRDHSWDGTGGMVLTRSLRIALLYETLGRDSQYSQDGCTHTTRIISCFSFPLSSYFGHTSQ